MKSPRQWAIECSKFYQNLYDDLNNDALAYELSRKTRFVMAEVIGGTVGSVFADMALVVNTPDTLSRWVTNVIASAGSLALIGLGFGGLPETNVLNEIQYQRSESGAAALPVDTQDGLV